MKDIAIYGAGGLGREVACLLKHLNQSQPMWNLIGFFDDTLDKGQEVQYGPILGGVEDVNSYNEELAIIIAIGSSVALKTIISKINNPQIYFPNLVAPDVIFHDKESISIGKGNILFFHSIISCNAQIGDFNVLNNNSMIGHDTLVGSFNVFNPSVRISGNVKIGDANFFGVCSVVLQNIIIGNDTRIAANSCIMRNTKDHGLYIGTPAILRLTPNDK